MNECKKYSETTVGKRTQWKPVVFAVKIFAVCIKVTVAFLVNQGYIKCHLTLYATQKNVALMVVDSDKRERNRCLHHETRKAYSQG